ncbi:MAG: GguC family protein [Edaphobacter sp.]|uniref:AraD1 family protein n=1 Tax=Edaphobacter sp. TaxID=1934404 RepID=UPI0023877DCE|nr:AraD1 family protein [Edaphobacter sp.]MDE1177363.1 GguC family protein [Edaphobacter sp.]
MRFVQLANGDLRGVALVEEPHLILLAEVTSVYQLAQRALTQKLPLTKLAQSLATGDRILYDDVYAQNSAWTLLAPIDVPGAPQSTLVSGTGLTHLGSARERQAMHTETTKKSDAEMTDSMRMFEWGREKGRPEAGEIGIAPEWFYKGDGASIRAPFAALNIPGHAEDGGEEGEIAAIYLIDSDGEPHRIGMCTGNEFSDHVFERKNYLNLAGSKLRVCSLGPEIVIGADFADVPGKVRVLRNGAPIWEKNIRTGEDNMCHSLANLEHHHFKFAGHRQPGMLHVHFLGADALSCGDNVSLAAGDVTEVSFTGFGRPLTNTIAADETMSSAVRVQPMA